MSKTTAATQTATVTVEQQSKKDTKKKSLFGLSVQDLQMVVGGGGVIIQNPNKP